MPDPKDTAQTVDTIRRPDLDSIDAAQVRGSPQADDGRDEGLPPGLKDKDAKTSNSYGNTRDSGERPEVPPKD